MPIRPGDLPKAEIVHMAEQAIRQSQLSGTPAQAFFKFTCEACGERCTFSDPNTIYDSGECCACGHVTDPIPAYGFMLQYSFE